MNKIEALLKYGSLFEELDRPKMIVSIDPIRRAETLLKASRPREMRPRNLVFLDRANNDRRDLDSHADIPKKSRRKHLHGRSKQA